MAKHVGPYCLLSLVGEIEKGRRWAMSLVTDGIPFPARRRSCCCFCRPLGEIFSLFFSFPSSYFPLISAIPGRRRHGAIRSSVKCVCATVTHRQVESVVRRAKARVSVFLEPGQRANVSLPSCHATSTLISCLPRPFRDS